MRRASRAGRHSRLVSTSAWHEHIAELYFSVGLHIFDRKLGNTNKIMKTPMAPILPFLKVSLIAWSCKQNTLSTIWCLLCVWLSFCRHLCCEANTDEPFQDRTMCDMMVFMANGDIGWYEIVVTDASIVIIILSDDFVEHCWSSLSWWSWS